MFYLSSILGRLASDLFYNIDIIEKGMDGTSGMAEVIVFRGFQLSCSFKTILT